VRGVTGLIRGITEMFRVIDRDGCRLLSMLVMLVTGPGGIDEHRVGKWRGIAGHREQQQRQNRNNPDPASHEPHEVLDESDLDVHDLSFPT
jgi:hypothetical protein